MDLWSTMATLRRRWRIALPVLALAVLGSLLVVANLGVDYETRASVVLAPPRPRVLNGVLQPRLVNKWEPRSLLPVVSRRLTNNNQKASLKAQGLSTRFTITVDPQAAVVDLTVLAKTAASSKASAEALLAATREATASIQALDGVPDDELITAEVVVLNNQPQPLTGARTRVGFALGVLGLGATVFVAFAAEDVARRRTPDAADSGPVIDLVERDTPRQRPGPRPETETTTSSARRTPPRQP